MCTRNIIVFAGVTGLNHTQLSKQACILSLAMHKSVGMRELIKRARHIYG